MAELPFHECARVREDEASEARESLLVSLDELRAKADRFVAIVESTATVFAALARSAQGPQSKIETYRPLPESNRAVSEARDPLVSPTITRLARGANVGERHPIGSNGTSPPRYPDNARLGPVESQPVTDEARVIKLVTPQAIVSPNVACAGTGVQFSFTVTTTGSPWPSITEKGDLPDHLQLTDNRDGTATISGVPATRGDFRVALKAKFGKGATKYMAVQTFTLTVTADA
jgi:hypothetical protein